MSNLHAQSATLNCPQCHWAFDAEVWLIVDVIEPKFALELAP
jgi:hypothetical protein